MQHPATILVTGASSGIGRATAVRLANAGHRVFGTSRQPDSPKAGVQEEEAGALDKVEMLRLDVHSLDSVAQLAAELRRRSDRLDAVINNAGVGLFGALEEASTEDARRVFETNYFGTVRVIDTLLPRLRHQREGHIINVGSALGTVAAPFLGHYSASKAALARYSEALRQEIAPLGIAVSLVEPGFVRTSFQAAARRPRTVLSAYSPWRGQALEAAFQHGHRAPGPEHVAATIERALRSRRPRFLYRAGQGSHALGALSRFAPGRLAEIVVRKLFQLDAASSVAQPASERQQV